MPWPAHVHRRSIDLDRSISILSGNERPKQILCNIILTIDIKIDITIDIKIDSNIDTVV